MVQLANLPPGGPDKVVALTDWPTLEFTRPRRQLAPLVCAVVSFAVVFAFLWAAAQREPFQVAPLCLPSITDCEQP